VVSLRPEKNGGLRVKKVCTVHCVSFTMHCMVASSIPCKLSLCADRAHACAGDSYVSSGIDVACPTSQSVFAIASPHELHGSSSPSSSTGTRSFCCNQQYSVYALTDSSGNVSERYAYTAYGQPTFLNASATVQTSSAANNRYTYTGREWDQTIGLTHFRARWISGVVGRFISRDTIGYGDGLSLYRNFFGIRDLDPTGFNRYVRSYTEYHLIGCHFSPDGDGCDLVCEYELQVYEQEGELIPPVPPGILVGLGPWRRAPEKPLTELFFIEVDPQYCGPCPTEFEHANPLPVPNDFDDPPTPWTPTRGLPPHPPLPPPPPLPPRNIA
jgi:RHS repeat-associated protein